MRICDVLKYFTLIFLCVFYINTLQAQAEKYLFIEKRAKKNNPVSEYLLGRSLFYRATKKDELKKALTWLRRSAEHGYLPSIIFLAEIYERGEKVKHDFIMSFKWYKKAKDLGSLVATEKLSFLDRKDDLNEFFLFDVPIFSINRFGVRYVFQKNGAKLVKEAGKDSFCDIFETSSTFIGTDKTQVCYLPSKKLAFFELRFPYSKQKQNKYLTRYYISLKEKYGVPQVKDNLFIWNTRGIEIVLWLEPKTNTVFLRYKNPERERELLKIKKEKEKRKKIIPNI